MDLLNESVLAAEGEISVRTYACTYYRSKILGFTTQGYLAVTNKRVIFQAISKLRNGYNLIQSEVPISSVAGINSFKGFYFSLPRLLLLLLLSFLVNTLTIALMTSLSFTLQSYTAYMIIGWLLAILGVAGSLFLKSGSTGQVLAASLGLGALLAMAGSESLMDLGRMFSRRGLSIYALLAIALVFYIFYLAIRNSRRPTFSLAIQATGAGTPAIQIASATGLGRLNISASRSLNAEPGTDSNQMLFELGAVIMDIQMLGDYGINKWRQIG